ncbi:MAG: DUF115 domain-containing protein [Treponemataceae bacterium]|nr:DUF115 domain-containing protein [Treponemataceae bacterium]
MNSSYDNNFKKNYSLFKSRFFQLANLIDENTACSLAYQALKKIEIIEAKDSNLTALQNGKAFHSKYNPIREADGLVQSQECSDNDTTILFSYGLAYAALEFAKFHPEKKLIIIESDLDFAFLPFLTTDLSPLFSHKNLILLFGLSFEEIIGFMESQKIEKYHLIKNPSQTLHNQIYFDQLEELFKRNIEKIKINNNTLKKFGKLWIRNTCKNFSSMNEICGISIFQDQFKDIPVLLVAAGPSLQSILPCIKEIQKKCLIVCVDTALKQLVRYGISPDFTVLMDSQYYNSRHLDFIKETDSILITEISAYPSVFKTKWKKTLFCHSQYPLGKIIENEINLGDLGAGGSVATSAWDFARFIGSRKIYMTGLDLGFPKNQTHVKGSTFENWALYHSNKLLPVDKKSVESIASADLILEKDYEGNELATDSRMKLYAWWFESRTAQYPQAKTYNLSKTSLAIPGIEYADLNSILSTKDLDQSIRQKIDELVKSSSSAAKINRNRMKKNFRKLLDDKISDDSNLDDLLKSFSDENTDKEICLEKARNYLKVHTNF